VNNLSEKEKTKGEKNRMHNKGPSFNGMISNKGESYE